MPMPVDKSCKAPKTDRLGEPLSDEVKMAGGGIAKAIDRTADSHDALDGQCAVLEPEAMIDTVWRPPRVGSSLVLFRSRDVKGGADACLVEDKWWNAQAGHVAHVETHEPTNARIRPPSNPKDAGSRIEIHGLDDRTAEHH